MCGARRRRRGCSGARRSWVRIGTQASPPTWYSIPWRHTVVWVTSAAWAMRSVISQRASPGFTSSPSYSTADTVSLPRGAPKCSTVPSRCRVARVGERAAGGAVDGIHARRLQPPAHLDALLHGVALPGPGEEGVVVLGDADLGLEVEVPAHLGTDGGNDLHQEAGPVLQGPPVLVRAVVDGRAEELGEKVAVGRVQLHAVQAGLPGPAGALGELAHHLFDLGDGHGRAVQAVHVLGLGGGGEVGGDLDAGDVALAPRVAELHQEAAVVLVDPFAQLAPEGDPLVAVDHGVVGDDAALQADRDEGRDDPPDATLGELQLPVDPGGVAGAVVVVEASGDVGAEDAVLDGEVAQRERLEEDVGARDALSHRTPPSRCGTPTPSETPP